MKIADGKIRGAIPKCPKCFAGNLNYNESKLNQKN